MANFDITNASPLMETDEEQSLLAFDDKNVYKLKLNENSQNMLIAAGLLVGKPGTGHGGEIFNNYSENSAKGEHSHAEGTYNHADTNFSHVEGYGNTSDTWCQHIEGILSDPSQKINYQQIDEENKLHIIGNGAGWDARSNAFFVTESGSAWHQDKVLTDNYFWARKSDRGGYAGSVFAENEIYVRLDEDGTYDRTYHGTDTVIKGYHRVPVLYHGNGTTPSDSLGQDGDLYCMIL